MLRRLCILFALWGAACDGFSEAHIEAPHGAPRPLSGIVVKAGSALQDAIDAAPAGGTLLLEPGDYQGPFRIQKPLTLWGPTEAVLRSNQGSTVWVTADSVSLLGFTVEGSGQRFDLMDGGINLSGKDLRVEGLTVRNALFGILVQACERVQVLRNTVIGTAIEAMGLRGDGIRLWETSDSAVIGNYVVDARDVVVWYSSRNRILDNHVRRCRYGTHFMYSNDNEVEGNRYVDNEVGIFIMYSRDISLQKNLLARSRGAAGIGLGIKESGNLNVSENWLLANTVGIYVDTAPLDPSHHNLYWNNDIRYSEVAFSMHASVKRTEVRDNSFRDNGTLVKVGGGGDALQCIFEENFYDGYQGYDFDTDGRGDVPYQFRRLSTQMEGRYPELALLHGAPAMALVDVVGEAMPLFAPRQLMQDERPRMRPKGMSWTPEADHAH